MRPRKLRWKAGRVLSVALVLLPPTWPLQAQSLRDPTVAPGVGTASPHALVEPPADLEAINVVVRDGKPYLLVDGLLLNEGSRLQGMRIERIGEAAVWLRSGKRVIKLPRFPGVAVKPAQERATGHKP